MSTTHYTSARRGRSVLPLVVAGLIVAVSGAGLWAGWWGGRGDPAAVPLSTQEEPARPVVVAPPLPEEATGKIPAPESPGPVAAPADFVAEAQAAVKKAEDSGDADALRRAMGTFVLDRRLPEPLREEWFKKVDDLNHRIVFSATASPGFAPVEIRRGDSYWKICERLRSEKSLHVTPGLLEAINHIPTSRLKAGQQIKVPQERLSLLVDKSEFRLYVLLGGVYVMRFPVGIGREDLTPEGRFDLGGKMSKPPWTDPKTGKTIRYGEPGHIIGSRWMALLQDKKKTSYGIHGTVDPASVGKAQSDGCIRLANEDVEQLFELVPEGTPVVIRG